MSNQQQDTTYNGWKNYETWCVNMWLSNEAYLSESVQSVHGLIGDAASSELETYKMCDTLKNFVEELAEQTCEGVTTGASFVADLFGSALGSVDWLEIVTNWAEEMGLTVSDRLYTPDEDEAHSPDCNCSNPYCQA